MNKSKIRNIAVTGSLLSIFAIASTMAFFSSTDAVTNRFTVGEVKIQVDEDNYEDNLPLAYEQKITKDPKVSNAGKNDAVVFLRVTVPLLKDVTFVMEREEHEVLENYKDVEIFDFYSLNYSEGHKTSNRYSSKEDVAKTVDTVFEYDENWFLLSQSENQDNTKTYLFGYSKIVTPENASSTLFDSMQMKSIYETDFSDTVKKKTVRIEAYGIQAKEISEAIGDYNDASQVTISAQTLTQIYQTNWD